ncbi:MAG: hypothetical protein IJ801_03375 [Lachnospiraceae bacterium]|nr:hypothetical protein [Lachnospiraceae bacterium]
MKQGLKCKIALIMAMVLSISTFGQSGAAIFAKAEETDQPEEIVLYDAEVRTDLDADEIAKAEDINVLIDSDYDVTNVKDGIEFDDTKVSVSYVEGRAEFDPGRTGEYDTYYMVEPYSRKDAYLIHRIVTVDEPETTESPQSDDKEEEGAESDEEPEPVVGEERNQKEFPLSAGEIENIQSSTASFTIILDEDQEASLIEEGIDPATGNTDEDLKDEESSGGDADQASLWDKAGQLLSKAADVIFPPVTAYAAEKKDTMQVSYSGYASYCGHRTGIKYISESGDYNKHLVYCMDMKQNTTNGTVTAGGKIKAQITFCLVNGARTLGGKCHTSKYSSGSADADYFITSAAIHVLNGEVKLSYYNDGSGVYKNI